MALTKSLSFSIGRKRILISNNSFDLHHFCADFTPFKKLCSPEFQFQNQIDNSTSLLESLPCELLNKVVCGVDHDDLKRLLLVSKTVRDAAIIAKKEHFAYSTPSKTKAFKDSIELLKSPEHSGEFGAPNAPKQARKSNRKRLDTKTLRDVAVALFPTDEAVDEEEEEQRSPRRSLFMDVEC